MSKKHTVLIIENNENDRRFFKDMLCPNYDVEEASSSDEAFSILNEKGEKISVILLDFTMDGIDGCEFLRVYMTRTESTMIPVIALDSSGSGKMEADAFRLGAYDFIKKPYDSEIILLRLENVLLKSQYASLREFKDFYEHDTLTGLYNQSKFNRETHKMLISNPDRKFTMVRFDINCFHLINAYFGTDRANNILLDIASELRRYITANFDTATYSRVGKDVFIYCIPTADKAEIEASIKNMNSFLKKENLMFKMYLCCGICIIDDNSMSVTEAYDKTIIAAKACKGSYTNYYEYYTKSMDDKAKEAQEIVDNMERAVTNGEFEVWYQPKYDIINNIPMGAEALVRWRHPKRGLIAPNKFIPVFESNGFITTLDRYVWEQTCKDLAFWMSKGCKFPVSINVSRVNLIQMPVIEVLNSLTEKYNIPHNMLNIEVTESVYTKDPQLLIDIVNNLKREGYLIFMDDFGSGYSSLSLLKDIDVNVLKIDMQFFKNGILDVRSKNILASIINMAKLLNMSVIAEGVETKTQVEFLKAWGCEYVQGYYFAKPMPKAEYEDYLKNNAAG